MQKFPVLYHAKIWARFAVCGNEENSKKYNEMLNDLSKEELEELLSFLAGYLRTSSKSIMKLTSE